MVTSTGPQEIDENIEIITPETPEEQAPGGDEVATEEQATEEIPVEAPDAGDGQPSEARLLNDTAPQQAQPAQSQINQQAIAELKQRRIAEQEQMWRGLIFTKQ